jgi:peptidyl-prolyl cis-trans isomerase B (cyclophilin B)
MIIFTLTKRAALVGLFCVAGACQQNTISEKKETSTAPATEKTTDQTIKEKVKKPDYPDPLTDSTVVFFYQNYADSAKQQYLKIKTSFGNIVIKLYTNTPLHRANMLYLTKQGYFNGTWFHRVSKSHVIQAGNNDEEKTVEKRRVLGDFTIPAEALTENFHKRGAVAAARSYRNNPEKRSDPYEFYIVLGTKYTAKQLEALAEKNNLTFSQRQKELYASQGGAPHLDGEHTVFGKVVEGMEVVEAISQVKVDSGEWPLKNIPIKVETIKK